MRSWSVSWRILFKKIRKGFRLILLTPFLWILLISFFFQFGNVSISLSIFRIIDLILLLFPNYRETINDNPSNSSFCTLILPYSFENFRST